MTESFVRRNEFAKVLQDELARIWREGGRRIDRAQVEEIGRRLEVDRDEALRIFVDSKGALWEGAFVESEEEPGWEAVELANVPSTGTAPDSSV